MRNNIALLLFRKKNGNRLQFDVFELLKSKLESWSFQEKFSKKRLLSTMDEYNVALSCLCRLRKTA